MESLDDKYLIKRITGGETDLFGCLVDRYGQRVFSLIVRVVKNREDAQILFGIANDGEENVRIIKELKDTNLTHCYNQKRVREIVSSNLKRKGINIKISQYDLKIICDKFDLKSNEKYFYKHTLTNSWGCSQHLVDFVTELILKDNNIICELKEEYKQKKI